MQVKSSAFPIIITPANGGVIVQRGPHPSNEGMMIEQWVFTDHEELSKFLFGFFVDVEGELKERAKRA